MTVQGQKKLEHEGKAEDSHFFPMVIGQWRSRSLWFQSSNDKRDALQPSRRPENLEEMINRMVALNWVTVSHGAKVGDASRGSCPLVEHVCVCLRERSPQLQHSLCQFLHPSLQGTLLFEYAMVSDGYQLFCFCCTRRASKRRLPRAPTKLGSS